MVKGNINNENGRNASSKISLFTIYGGKILTRFLIGVFNK
jgi:hypothetical protein